MTDHHDVSDHDLLIEIRGLVGAVKDQLVRLNGRVIVLEQWKQEVLLEKARIEGATKERGRIRKGEWTIVAFGASLIGGVTASVIRLMESDLFR